MPEGPETHRAADTIRKALAGRAADEIFFAFDDLREQGLDLIGREVEEVEARGKAIVTRFEGGVNVYSHNQLYGRWMVRNRGNVPKTNRQLRFAVHNQKKSAFLYSASEIEVLSDDELEQQPYLAKLGPDPLRDEVTRATIRRRFHDRAFHGRQVGSLLLDQGFVGGIGNYLRSEILWVGRCLPRRKLGDLETAQRRALADATYDLMQRAYELGGITNDPAVVTKMKEDGRKRWEYRHYVFARASKRCYRCGSKIVKDRQGNRRVYVCTGCQD